MGPGKKMIISTVIVDLIIITLLIFYFLLFVHCSSSVFEPANFSMARLHTSPDAPPTPFYWFLNQSLIIFLLFWRIILFLEYGNTHNHHLFSCHDRPSSWISHWSPTSWSWIVFHGGHLFGLLLAICLAELRKRAWVERWMETTRDGDEREEHGLKNRWRGDPFVLSWERERTCWVLESVSYEALTHKMHEWNSIVHPTAHLLKI